MDTPSWVRTPAAVEALCLSEKTLLRLRQRKVLKAGDCWRRTIPNNRNSHVIYNIPACQEVLSGLAAASEMEQDRLSKIREVEVSQA